MPAARDAHDRLCPDPIRAASACTWCDFIDEIRADAHLWQTPETLAEDLNIWFHGFETGYRKATDGTGTLTAEQAAHLRSELDRTQGKTHPSNPSQGR